MKSSPRLAVFLLLSVCLFSLGSAAIIAAPGDDWRPVDPAELSSKTALVEKDADAEAIFWEVRIDDSSSDELSLQHYVRVKIFTERGREKYSKFDIPFIKGTKIKDVAARVTKVDGSSVEIQKTDIFEREIIKANGLKVKAKTFAVPNIEPGVIIEYRYREVISDTGASGMHLQFQRDIPVQTLSYYYKPYDKAKPNYQSFNFNDTKFVEDQKGFWLATRKNVASLKEEPRMPPENQVIPWMLLQSVRLNFTAESVGSITFTIKNPNDEASYWGSVGHEKSLVTKFMNKPNKEIKKTATDLTASAQTQDEKLQKLYEFCQTQIKNTSFDPSITDEQRKKLPKIESMGDVLKYKTARAQYIDMLFGAMANSLGYDTRIAFSGDRSQIFFRPDMTNESFIHPAAIAVKVGDDWKFFNPGMSFLPYGMLIWYEDDVWALLVGETRFDWAKTPYSEPKQTVVTRTGRFTLLEDGTLEGDVRFEYGGQLGLSYKLDGYDESDNKREEDFKADIKRRISTAEISDLKIENITDPNKPVIYTFKVRVPGYAQKTGKRLFLQPSFFEYGGGPMFSSATRKYDVYFHYPWSEKDNIEITLPAGFELDNADRPAPISAGEISQYKVDLGVSPDKRKLVLHRDFFFGGGGNVLFPHEGYTQLKTLFDQIRKNDEHTITLKQAAAN